MIQKVIVTFLFLLSVVANFKSGTYLSIWDTIHSEFNFKLDIIRNLFSVWQEYRGLGLLDGMAHAADLPRQIFLWFSSILLPMETLRYFYHFFMLFTGAFGIYFLLHELLFADKDKDQKNTVSLIGALFYLLNFGTIQYFFVPLEAFSTFWGIFPWCFYTLLSLFRDQSRKRLLLFFIAQVFPLPSFYIPTLFLVYLLWLVLTLLVYLWSHRERIRIGLALKVLVLVFIVNSFWLLPNIYFLFHGAKFPMEAKINQMSSEDTYLQNKRRGTIGDFLLLRGYYYDFVEEQKYMMEPWQLHLNNKTVLLIGYIFSGLVVLGFLVKNPYKKYIFVPFIISASALLSDVFPASFIQSLVRENASLLDQLFRSPFTKFIVPAIFSFSIFLGLGVNYILELILNLTRNKRLTTVLLFFIFTIFILYFSYPVFTGYLFSPNARVKIPEEYFAVFNFFKNQDHNTRISTFPQSSFWGWESYRWGYRGSGFIWQGIPQPILDRAFDVWSDKNENYYWEISYALYSKNASLLEALLSKYQISWLLIDENLVNFSSAKGQYTTELNDLLISIPNIKLVNNFGKIKTYHVDLKQSQSNFVYLKNNLPIVGPDYKWNNYDKAYEEYGDYISIQAKDYITNSNIYYPFRSLFTGKIQKEMEFGIEDKGEYLSFKAIIPKDLTGYSLIVPMLEEKETAEVDNNDLTKKTIKNPQIFLDGELLIQGSPSLTTLELPYIKDGNLEVRVSKINGYYSYNLQPTTYNLQPKSCNRFNKGLYKHDQVSLNGINLLRLISKSSSNCLDFDLYFLTNDLGYLISIQNRNLIGKSLLFSVVNNETRRPELETYLPKPKTYNLQLATSYFVIPPMEHYGLGYTLNIDNISIDNSETINDLGMIKVNPIPYRLLTSMKIVNPNFNLQSTTYNSQPISVSHPNSSLYQIELNNLATGYSSNPVLILSQSFDDGWKAYSFNREYKTFNNFLMKNLPFLFGKEIKDHFLVNNWENGWQIPQSTINPSTSLGAGNQQSTIIIVYLPQYLEYLGFLILGIGILVIILYSSKTKHINIT